MARKFKYTKPERRKFKAAKTRIRKEEGKPASYTKANSHKRHANRRHKKFRSLWATFNRLMLTIRLRQNRTISKKIFPPGGIAIKSIIRDEGKFINEGENIFTNKIIIPANYPFRNDLHD